MKKYYIIIIVLTFYSCKRVKKKPIKESISVESIDDKTQFLRNDNLISIWKKELYQFYGLDLEYKIEIESHKFYNREKRDTLKILTYKDSHFIFLKRNDEFLLSGGLIKDRLFSISPNIKIGMTKTEFGEILKTEIKRDIVDISGIVSGIESKAMFFFEFRNDILNNISYEWGTE